MNIINHIKKIHETSTSVPGRLYHTGLEIKEMVPYQDTGNLHESCHFCWFEYTFNHTGNGINFNLLYMVLYDYRADREAKAWFDQKCTDLFSLDFAWSESSGTFYLSSIWSCYWEQVNRYDKKEWAEYLSAINEAIKNKS